MAPMGLGRLPAKKKNRSELLLTNGMGLDRAPDEILTFIFSPFEMRPPNSAAVLRTRPLYGFDGSKVESVQLQFI